MNTPFAGTLHLGATLVNGSSESEPPVSPAPRSHAREMLSQELAVLNLPLEDEIEYYDEAPVRRWPKRLAVFAAFAAVAGVVYLFVAPRHRAPAVVADPAPVIAPQPALQPPSPAVAATAQPVQSPPSDVQPKVTEHRPAKHASHKPGRSTKRRPAKKHASARR
jgi:hypothetical protein